MKLEQSSIGFHHPGVTGKTYPPPRKIKVTAHLGDWCAESFDSEIYFSVPNKFFTCLIGHHIIFKNEI